MPFIVDSRWYAGEVNVPTFAPDELLGTKLRALYQRKKGRDLLDLWHALESGGLNPSAVLSCFQRYMAEGGHAASRAQNGQNSAEKLGLDEFRDDIEPLLRPGVHYVQFAPGPSLGRVMGACYVDLPLLHGSCLMANSGHTGRRGSAGHEVSQAQPVQMRESEGIPDPQLMNSNLGGSDDK